MHGLKYTKHFQHRAKQRGVNAIVVSVLLKYGVSRLSRSGVDSIFFTNDALQEIKNDYGPSLFKMCEKFKNTYIIMSDDGALITVARSYRRSVH